MSVKNYLEKQTNFIQKLISKGGPTKEDYENLDNWYYNVWDLYTKGDLSIDEIEQLRAVLSPVYGNTSAMLGQVYTAPYGYKGDFEIIDRMYQDYVSDVDYLANWDRYFHRAPATLAVKNRKDYFKKLLQQKAELKPNLQVLNLASGPCRDLKEFYEESDCKDVEFDCVELDSNAIEYAKNILNADQKTTFIQKNIFKFSTQKKYDLIWSAGLFDYFNDKIFSRMLSRILDYTTENGEIVIGNFNTTNPTKNCMDFTAWHLHHRNKEDLTRLAMEAGAKQEQISIEQETQGINLFLRIKSNI